MDTPWVSSDQERTILETCLAECKRRLNRARKAGNELLEATLEADMNRMLEELKHLHKRTGARL